jgi:glycosyltransferase involved in cell wall biosynthesis
MKVFLLADVPGWIVDRLTDYMIAEMPDIDWIKGYYATLSTDDIMETARECDLVHYGNWDIAMHWPRINDGGKPLLVSVRSHRYPDEFRFSVAPHVKIHAITRAIQEQFSGSWYVPDALVLDVMPLRVGFVGKPGPYKRSEMIRAACEQIGAQYWPTTDRHEREMPDFYRGMDVIVCASIAEGFSTVVMEALANHRPVISTRTGSPWEAQLPGVTWFDGTTEGLVAALRPLARPIPDEFLWPSVTAGLRKMYQEVLAC